MKRKHQRDLECKRTDAQTSYLASEAFQLDREFHEESFGIPCEVLRSLLAGKQGYRLARHLAESGVEVAPHDCQAIAGGTDLAEIVRSFKATT